MFCKTTEWFIIFAKCSKSLVERARMGVTVESPLRHHVFSGVHNDQQLTKLLYYEFTSISTLLESWFTIYPLLAPKIADVTIPCSHKELKTFNHHTKQLKTWPNLSASNAMNYSRLSACQAKMELFKDHPSTRGCLTSFRNKPQQKQPGQLSVPISA